MRPSRPALSSATLFEQIYGEQDRAGDARVRDGDRHPDHEPAINDELALRMH